MRRYLALGDSFTIGTGTTPDRSFPAVLVSRWCDRGEEWELRNPAVNGYTTDDLILDELSVPVVRHPEHRRGQRVCAQLTWSSGGYADCLPN